MRTKAKVLRRIRTLYVLFFVAIIVSVIFSVASNDFLTGFNDARRDLLETDYDHSTQGLPSAKHFFNLNNRTVNQEHDIAVICTADSSMTVSARVQSFDLRILAADRAKLSSGQTVAANVLLMLVILMYLGIFVIIFLILSSVRASVKSENIFDRSNIMLTRAIGILLICASLCGSLSQYLETQFVAQFITNSSLVVNTAFMPVFSDIITGILILFIAEIFAIGYDLSQEQTLTI